MTVNIIPRILHIYFFFTLIYPVKSDNEAYLLYYDAIRALTPPPPPPPPPGGGGGWGGCGGVAGWLGGVATAK